MKWIGVIFAIIGALLFSDHRNGIVPMALGTMLIGYCYFFEREPVQPSLDESDWLHREELSPKLEESSTDFDLRNLEPFLRRLGPYITGGYSEKAIAHITQAAHRMKHGEERSLECQVTFQQQQVPLNIGLFKDDVDEITVYFHTTQSLVKLIDAETQAFIAEREM